MQKKIGPAWTERGRPPAGYFTKRTAEDWLRDVLGSGAARDVARHGANRCDVRRRGRGVPALLEQDRGRKPSTVRDYRSVARTSHLLPAFGAMPLEVDHDRGDRAVAPASLERLSNRTKNKLLILLHGIFRRAQQVYGSGTNPCAMSSSPPQRRAATSRCSRPRRCGRWCARRPEQDAAIFLTAAFTGLRRGELLALRWRDVDFTGSVIRVRASYAAGRLTTPKSGKVRSVPMAPDVAAALAQLGARAFDGRRRPVFAGEAGTLSRRLSAAAPLQGRAERALACGRCGSTTCATRSARG